MSKQFTCSKCGGHGWVSHEPPLGKPVIGHCDRCLLGGQEISVFLQALANDLKNPEFAKEYEEGVA